MASNDRPELLHMPASAALARSGARSGLVARGRRDAAQAATQPDYLEAVRRYKAGDFAVAAAHFRIAAEQGHAESQYMLSTMFDAGEGVEQDAEQAGYWERKAAEQGHAYAQANLSYRKYTVGALAEAFTWCMRAAQSKLAWAQFHVGLMYRKGEGVAQSDADAAGWYRQAAEQNFPDAQQKLAELYTLGLGVAQDFHQAAGWYQKAALQGNAEAQFQLAHLYATGQGVETDYVRSREWIRQAALQGHAQAVRELRRRQYRDP